MAGEVSAMRGGTTAHAGETHQHFEDGEHYPADEEDPVEDMLADRTGPKPYSLAF